jgi:hypothetical protein
MKYIVKEDKNNTDKKDNEELVVKPIAKEMAVPYIPSIEEKQKIFNTKGRK